ncbi:MAG: crossover junction endodeoxyribonuclease RuvC [Bdellovibrionales bacterium RIFOXYB1_FULL_37_110]|nr:MAG: crossover junction endodeoxyribonuclease RuvC [Bdellovibrionales bacterium RIFOXYA1_FULL_38_20]OFZ48053.1 MAG: crossover junction endodeoxyribonuclease RuvC [Bdellovibrionales bacterium RIFOXYC1_FULL_37_79]OFZ58061.1 MAG: crossover junction endodeoxyribonuclease RuvC [Bdellovibrionales bacterium RIFOXYB1_FULL_37_110]OFZ58211.1 MAG: crossover junction endodeoxyribonuclease RuvC [Bdellovibrionales bacterium RIFOXYB2_FULL_36_6]OFZ63346.1 MAG: crossover junction endodeoxyribonuclease RuvC [
MIILGIDPGSLKAGYAVIELENKKYRYLASGAMKYGHIETFIDRLGVIFNSCKNLMEEYRPDEIAIESLVYVKGTTSILKLAQARGAMLAAFNLYKQGHIYEYSPNEIKSCVSGHGHAEKESIQKALDMVFKGIIYKTDDESDALAIAFAHTLSSRKLQINITSRQKKSRGTRLRDLRN